MNIKKQKVAIIDYGAGNVKSISNILEYLGCAYSITPDKEEIKKADKVIFPGQGHFEQAMNKLKSKDMVSFLQDLTAGGKEFLGVCLGLQVLFEKSEEAPEIEGLKIFKGNVVKFKKGKTPQIGWTKIKTTLNNTLLSDEYFYFVNSYYINPEDKNIISSYANYHIDFASSVQYKNITAVQFHPEKSSSSGIKFFENWILK